MGVALPREGPNWGPLWTNLASNTVAGLIDNFGTAPVCGITLRAAVWQPKWQPVAAAASAAAVGDRTLSVAATASFAANASVADASLLPSVFVCMVIVVRSREESVAAK